ncbi:MAG: glycosyltransferase family 9 protein [Bacteroidota bacterium]
MRSSGIFIKRRKRNLNGKRVIISRTDSIGDVVLSLPVAGVLKELYPECTIIFLGKTYTKTLIEHCSNVDEFVNWDEIKRLDKSGQAEAFRQLNADVIIHVFPVKAIAVAAKKAHIKIRLGTTNRLWHWHTCNLLTRLSRKNSPWHESQLNLKLLIPFGAISTYPIHEIPAYYGLQEPGLPKPETKKLLKAEQFNLILHPGSKGSAREWGVSNFASLIEILPPEKFNIFITGTKEEGESVNDALIAPYKHVHDLTGKLTLDELISFIAVADGMVACSTGPLHIAAAVGKYAMGIFPPIRPMHPGRWAPVGINASVFVVDKKCSKCRKTKDCECIRSIRPEQVKERLMEVFK